MPIRVLLFATAFLGFHILFSNSTMGQEGRSIEDFAAVDGPYKLKSEIGIYGFVTQRSGEKVLFQPCRGEPQEISAAELEETDNNCADGGGPSFTSTCQEFHEAVDYARLFKEKDGRALEVGIIYEASGDSISSKGKSLVTAASKIHQLEACNNGWTVAYDKYGGFVTKMLAIDPSLLSDSPNAVWQR